LISLETDREVFNLPGEVDFKTPNGVAEMVFQLNQLRFEQPGVYALEFLAQGELLGSRKFQVGSPPNQRT
jgi:hypothetical protein